MTIFRPVRPGTHILIVGGGFSGTLLAINLALHNGPQATLVERHASQLARGVAYSAADDSHLLNVRASNMSAFPDDPDHFCRWLASQDRRAGDEGLFVRRTTYGRYLAEQLEQIRGNAEHALHILDNELVAIKPSGERVEAHFRDGRSESFDAAVIAVGNLPPHAPGALDRARLPADLYCDDPWSADIAEGLSDADTVLLLGTGLTAIDAALLLERRGYRGKIIAMSRRGLRPRAHRADQPAVQPANERPARHLSDMVRAVRSAANGRDWRCAVDALRPVTQMIWAAADDRSRARFLRHLRPFWDVHRHRLAPEVAAQIDAMVFSGRLTFRAGKLISAEAEDRAFVRVASRPRGKKTAITEQVRRIVNCTGPQGDLLRTDEPLLRQLLETGQIRPDAARLGIDVGQDMRVIDAAGNPSSSLYAIGPMTRGAYWEIVAVPDIRRQAWNLARSLSNAQWVAAEGL